MLWKQLEFSNHTIKLSYDGNGAGLKWNCDVINIAQQLRFLRCPQCIEHCFYGLIKGLKIGSDWRLHQNKSVIIRLLNGKKSSFINDKEILSFACYNIIKLSREFSESSEDFRARVSSLANIKQDQTEDSIKTKWVN